MKYFVNTSEMLEFAKMPLEIRERKKASNNQL